MGIYDSGLSVWERNKRGLPADTAAGGVIGEKEEIKVSETLEESPEEEVTVKVEKPKTKHKVAEK